MDTYIERLPQIVSNLCLLLKDRGLKPPDNLLSKNIVQGALDADCSIGEFLTCSVGGLKVCWVDPIFDVMKCRDVMTSACQIFGAIGDWDGEALVVCYSKLSPDANKETSKFKKKIQIITFALLSFPITRHIMVPRHTRLTDAEASEWETKNKILRKQLPVLKMSDPVRQWYGWEKQSIIHIARNQGDVYRCVSK